MEVSASCLGKPCGEEDLVKKCSLHGSVLLALLGVLVGTFETDAAAA
jgi:hypothetical protein